MEDEAVYYIIVLIVLVIKLIFLTIYCLVRRKRLSQQQARVYSTGPNIPNPNPQLQQPFYPQQFQVAVVNDNGGLTTGGVGSPAPYPTQTYYQYQIPGITKSAEYEPPPSYNQVVQS